MLKQYVRDLFVNPILAPAVRMLRAPVTILLLHRFETDAGNGDVMSATALRDILAYLRREGIPLVSLKSLVDTMNASRKRPANAVVFTVDDGYADFNEIAVPIFAEFDCPVTLFVTTGPVDNRTWFWWDRLTYAFDHSTARTLELKIGDRDMRYTWSNRRDAVAASQRLADELKFVSNADRLDAIDSACAILGVDTTAHAAPGYTAMTWDEIQALATTGIVDVGPHTVTHPILSRLTPDEVRFEIQESYRRLREMCPQTIPIFAYPNGRQYDYTPPVLQAVSEAGFDGAVTTEQQHVHPRTNVPFEEFLLPRFSCPNGLDGVIQVVSGIESLKTSARQRF